MNATTPVNLGNCIVGSISERVVYVVLQRLVIDKGDRVMVSSSYKESDKEISADGEVNKEAVISPEVRDKDERKERVVLKRKDKEEWCKDDITENKTVTAVAGEFCCKDCKEGRKPLCFACGTIQDEKTGRGHRQCCAAGKHL